MCSRGVWLEAQASEIDTAGRMGAHEVLTKLKRGTLAGVVQHRYLECHSIPHLERGTAQLCGTVVLNQRAAPAVRSSPIGPRHRQ